MGSWELMADLYLCPECRVERPPAAKCPQCGGELIATKTIGLLAADEGPKTVGRYELEEQVGSGGMGVVWRAHDPELKRTVALKLLHADLPDEIKRLHREAQIAARLRHANIGAVFDVGMAGGQAYVAMEFIDGQSADKMAFPVRRAVEVVRDAARAVQYAHEQDVVHRDLKPGNLMVDRKGRVFVMDFGLAKETRVDSSLSMSGAIMGTPSYMSPEQARGKSKHADARCDVWGLGATLYFLLTGHPPFEGDNAYEVAARVVAEDPPSPRKLNPRLPGDIETIVMRCLEKEPDRRYATSDELASDLTRFLDGEAIHARPASTLYRLRKSLSKRRSLVFAGLIAGLSILVAAGFWAAKFSSDRSRRVQRDSALAEAEARFGRGDFAGAKSLYDEAKGLGAEIDAGRYGVCLREERDTLKKSARTEQYGPVLDRCRFALDEFAKIRGSMEPDLAAFRAIVAEASGLLERALAQDPDWWQLYLVRGQLHMECEELDLAIADFSRALELDPAASAPRIWRGRAFLEKLERGMLFLPPSTLYVDPRSSQWTAQARSDFSVDRGTIEEDERLLLGIYELVLSGRLREAIDALHVRLRARTQDGRLWKMLGRAEGMLGESAKAAEAFQRAIDSGENRASVFYLRAISLGALRKWTDCERSLTRALDLDPKFWMAWLQRGIARIWLERLPSALDDMSRAVSLAPASHIPWHHRGIVRALLKDFAGAIEDCTRSLRIEPGYGEAYRDRADARMRLGEWESGSADAELAVKHAPEDAQSYLQRARARLHREDFRGCIDDCTTALRLDARLSWAYGLRGSALLEAGDAVEAEKELTRAIELDPKWSGPYADRSRIRESRRDWRGAAEDLTAALLLAPSAELYHRRSWVRYQQEDWRSSFDDADRAVALAPHLLQARINRASAASKLGVWTTVLGDATEVLKQEPRNRTALRLRAAAYGKQKLWSEAIRDFTTLLDAYPDESSAYADRATSQKHLAAREQGPRRAGLLRAAVRDYEEFLRLAPEGPDKERVRNWLEETRGLLKREES